MASRSRCVSGDVEWLVREGCVRGEPVGEGKFSDGLTWSVGTWCGVVSWVGVAACVGVLVMWWSECMFERGSSSVSEVGDCARSGGGSGPKKVGGMVLDS